MRIIKPSFEIMYIPGLPLQFIEKCGRVCYKSEDKITDDSAEKFNQMITKSGHASVVEHCSVTVRIVCDRGVSHEIVRHRLFSFSQESTRYCNYTKEKFGNHLTFIKPCFFPEISVGEFKDEENVIKLGYANTKNLSWVLSMLSAEMYYNRMIKGGCSPQEARSVLPNSLKTEIVCTANFRNWAHFFKLRTSKKAHPQMREIARPLLDEFKKRIPVFFDGLNYES